jgi:hypothetical protein
MGMFTQSLLNQNHIMQRGNDGKEKRSAQELRARDQDPAQRADRRQENEENSGDL